MLTRPRYCDKDSGGTPAAKYESRGLRGGGVNLHILLYLVGIVRRSCQKRNFRVITRMEEICALSRELPAGLPESV